MPSIQYPPGGLRRLAAPPKDHECYARRYPDLSAKYCAGRPCDQVKLYYHFKTQGSAEGRTYRCGEPAKPKPKPGPAPAAGPAPEDGAGKAYGEL
ncbi:hypothetical protein M885DRAFT_577916 [Pelagophyceae sp. CCMP2097]|nr:hypothetical protein M885DRAFT_577916 [Pelagophyceae sp. CCMP2097]